MVGHTAGIPAAAPLPRPQLLPPTAVHNAPRSSLAPLLLKQ